MGKEKRTAGSKAAAQSTTIDPVAAWPFPTTESQAKARKPRKAAAGAPQSDETAEVQLRVPTDVAAAVQADPEGAAAALQEAAADRIQVAMVSLYTDPTQNQVEQLPAAMLVDSPYQPRTSYDETSLAALAETMRAVGVMQAILVRPLSVDGLIAFNRANPDRAGAHEGLYEIVYGHRRTRGARLADLATVPAIVRDLTDAQVRQLQAIENVQRENLKPLEEAAAYADYIKAHGVSKDRLAQELGLSRSHVYARLKLLTVVDSVKEALRRGEIATEVATDIARLHTPKIQEKALAAIKGKYLDMDDGGKTSVRRIKDLLTEKFTLKLSGALFETTDDALLPGAGACTTCSKRTENAPEYVDLAEDKPVPGRYYGGSFHGGPNLCTDPDCFDEKKKAHLRNKAGELEAKGKTVITGNRARALVSATGELKGGYLPLKAVKAELAKANKANEALSVVPVVIQNPRDGKTIEAVKVADLKAAGLKVKEAASKGPGASHQEQQRRYLEERKQKERQAEKDTRAHVAVLGAVRRKAAGAPLTTLALQLAAAVALKGVGYQEHSLIAALHGFKTYEALQKAVGAMPAERLATLLLDCALVDDVIADGYSPRKPEPLLVAAKHYGVDVATIRREVEKLPEDTKTIDLLDAIAESDPPLDPAGARPQDAPPKPIRTRTSNGKPSKAPAPRKPKLSARDAKQGIAHAMQTMEEAGASTPAGSEPGAADASQQEEASAAATALASIVNGPPIVQQLQVAGITTREQLADLDVDELVAITGQDHEAAGALILKARDVASEGAAA